MKKNNFESFKSSIVSKKELTNLIKGGIQFPIWLCVATLTSGGGVVDSIPCESRDDAEAFCSYALSSNMGYHCSISCILK